MSRGLPAMLLGWQSRGVDRFLSGEIGCTPQEFPRHVELFQMDSSDNEVKLSVCTLGVN